jgi:hypothetical protein
MIVTAPLTGSREVGPVIVEHLRHQRVPCNSAFLSIRYDSRPPNTTFQYMGSAIALIVNRAALELDIDPEEFDVIEPRMYRPENGEPVSAATDHRPSGSWGRFLRTPRAGRTRKRLDIDCMTRPFHCYRQGGIPSQRFPHCIARPNRPSHGVRPSLLPLPTPLWQPNVSRPIGLAPVAVISGGTQLR